MSATHDRARALLAEALALPVEAIADDASPETLEAWDSLAHARLVLAVEAARGHALPPEAALDLFSLPAIASALDARA